VKTTVEIPDNLFSQAKEFAHREGLTFRQVIELGLHQILDAKRQPPAPFRLRKASFKGKGLAEGLEWPEIRDMIYKGRGA
jgi:hypothetical protein